jgi:probable HAF family extracellular repeat protein
VGISGACSIAVGGLSARAMVLWENGHPTEIPAFGGIAWNTPMAINRWGDVVGFANASAADGANPNFRAFFWSRRSGIKQLLLPGDLNSQALGINDWGQVVGQSCGPSVCRGFLYQNGQITDLNEILTPGYSGHIEFAGDIDNQGRITGQTSDGGQTFAFVAAPVRGP